MTTPTTSILLIASGILAASVSVVWVLVGQKQERPRSAVNSNTEVLPGPLADYLAARKCGNAGCEIGENTTNCSSDCPAVLIRADQWTQVNGPFGGLITDLEKVGDRMWAATSYSYALGGNGVYEMAGDLAWKSAGGFGRSIEDVAVDLTDSRNVAFVATPDLTHPNLEDGLSVTWDGGVSWQEPDFSEGHATAMAMSRADSNLIFVGMKDAGQAQVFMSEDDGKNWRGLTPLPATDWSVRPIWAGITDEDSSRITVIAPDPADDNVLFVGTNSALFKSSDQGQSWRRVDSTFHRTDILDIKINAQEPGEVYVRVGVFEEQTCMGIAGMEDRQKANEIGRAKCAGIYKSDDLGETWQQLEASYFDPSEGGVFIDEHNPNIAYAIFSRQILKTVDGGRRWEEFFWTHDQEFIPNVGVERLVVGRNSREVFIAGRQGLWQTTDAGQHWEERNKGFIGSEVVDIVKASDGALYAGTYTLGIFKSTDAGMNWTFSSYQLENPYLMLLAPHPTDPATIFATTNGGVYASRNRGLTWQRVDERFFGRSAVLPGVAHFHGIAFDPHDPKRIYLGGGGDQYTPIRGGGMSLSQDGGRTWRQSNRGFETDVHVSKIVVDPNNSAIVYATTQGPTNFQEKTGSGHGVFRSTDYGATWTKINQGLETVETNTLALDPNGQNALYLGTDDDGVYKSVNGGGSWQKIKIPQLPDSYGVGDIIVDPRNSQVVYVATVDYFRLAESRGVVGDYGVYISQDGGATWQSFNDGLKHVGAFSLELDAEKRILYVGTRGGGVYWRKIQ
ncbi:MAG: hypothetical protein HYY50_00845 [Candidatus Kerfeldbacteria bacterium]|nr:hypothetical protein [Candidatus Kerfeldbacteria bacterium]